MLGRKNYTCKALARPGMAGVKGEDGEQLEIMLESG